MECNGSLWRTEIRSYASCIEHNFFFMKSRGVSFWILLFLPIILIFAVLSVPSYQSVPRYISLHLCRSSSFNLSLSHVCLYLSAFTHLFQLFLIKSYFTPLALLANTMWQTVSQTGILRQNRDTCTRITHLVKCILSDTMDALDRPLFTFVYWKKGIDYEKKAKSHKLHSNSFRYWYR